MKLEVACEVLGLQFQAGSRPSDEDAKRAYRTLALANHPDKVRLTLSLKYIYIYMQRCISRITN
jgi:preprotein translocase subunit Sec63